MQITQWGHEQGRIMGHRSHGGHHGSARGVDATLQDKATQSVVASLRLRLVGKSAVAQNPGGPNGSPAGATPSSTTSSSTTPSSEPPMQSLVATLQAALSVGVANGQDPIPKLLGVILGALGDAHQSLTRSGVSAADATSAVSAVSDQLTAAITAAPLAAPASASAVATAAPAVATSVVAVPAAASPAQAVRALTYTRQQKASLDIVTQEGDRVQIQFLARGSVQGSSPAVPANAAPANAVSADSSSATDGSSSSSLAVAGTAATASSGAAVYPFSSGRIEVSVQGQLNTDEMKAIGELMSKVDALAGEFFQGDVQHAFASAAALGFDPSQIAHFALQLSQKVSVRPIAAPTPVKVAGGNAATGASPASAAVIASSSTPPVPAAAPLPLPDNGAGSGAGAVASAGTADNATNAGAGTQVVGTTDSGATLQDTLFGFLRKILDGMAPISGGGRVEFSMRWKLNLVSAAVEANASVVPTGTALAGTAAADTAGTVLLTKSLQYLAAQAPESQAAAGDTGSSSGKSTFDLMPAVASAPDPAAIL